MNKNNSITSTYSKLGPGLLLLISLTFISNWISKFLGQTIMGLEKSPISAVLVAILLGILISNIINIPDYFNSGISFGTKILLKVGIVLLGIRLSLLDIFSLVQNSIPIVIVCVIIGLFLPHIINRWLKLPSELVTLISVGTCICGVSAIVATSESLNSEKKHIAYAIATITLFGLLATILYPLLAWVIFKGNSLASGLFLGTAIHDTSQVAGAAFLYRDYFNDPNVVEIATVVKLLRNTLMIFVIPAVTIHYSRKENKHIKKKLFISIPMFIIWFVVMTILRTAGDKAITIMNANIYIIKFWENIIYYGSVLSSFLITMALAAVGLKTSISVFKGIGIKPLLIGFFVATVVGIVGVAMIFVLIL